MVGESSETAPVPKLGDDADGGAVRSPSLHGSVERTTATWRRSRARQRGEEQAVATAPTSGGGGCARAREGERAEERRSTGESERVRG